MKIKIKNLRLRTIIGVNDWERTTKQDVIINVKIKFDGKKAAITDDLNDTLDYKSITKKIITQVEHSDFLLLEKLADFILRIVFEDKNVLEAKVEVDKPHALRFADSVSVSCSMKRDK